MEWKGRDLKGEGSGSSREAPRAVETLPIPKSIRPVSASAPCTSDGAAMYIKLTATDAT